MPMSLKDAALALGLSPCRTRALASQGRVAGYENGQLVKAVKLSERLWLCPSNPFVQSIERRKRK